MGRPLRLPPPRASHHPTPATALAFRAPRSTKGRQNTRPWPAKPLPLRRFTNPRAIASPHFPAHKRPVFDRAVCGFAAIDIAAVLWLTPKHFAAIQLPRTKRSFPKPRAASGWLPAAAFIRQTRRPKPARSFWCLFLKKARLFVTETLVRAPRAIQRVPRYTLSASHPPPFRVPPPPFRVPHPAL